MTQVFIFTREMSVIAKVKNNYNKKWLNSSKKGYRLSAISTKSPPSCSIASRSKLYYIVLNVCNDMMI